MNGIVAEINTLLSTNAALQNFVTYGIADPVVVRGEEDGMEYISPMVIDSAGECNGVFFDDVKNVHVYHRMNLKTYETQRINGFGDTPQRVINADMSMIVCGRRDAIDSFRLEQLCVEAIESVAKGKKTVFTEVTQTNFNRIQVFQSEYTGIQFPIQPNIFLFKVNYKIKRIKSPC